MRLAAAEKGLGKTRLLAAAAAPKALHQVHHQSPAAPFFAAKKLSDRSWAERFTLELPPLHHDIDIGPFLTQTYID